MNPDSIDTKKITCKLGVLSRPDGSALLIQGETAVIAGTYGPIEGKPQKTLTNKACVEICYRPKSGFPGIGDRLYENILEGICECALASALYPRSSILVVIQEMQNCGGLISCAVNAACLALLCSGIDMKFLVAGVNCAIDEEGVLILEPDMIQLQSAKATFIFVFDSSEKHIVASHTSGSFNLEQYDEALKLCKGESDKIFAYYKEVIKDNVIKPQN